MPGRVPRLLGNSAICPVRRHGRLGAPSTSFATLSALPTQLRAVCERAHRLRAAFGTLEDGRVLRALTSAPRSRHLWQSECCKTAPKLGARAVTALRGSRIRYVQRAPSARLACSIAEWKVSS